MDWVAIEHMHYLTSQPGKRVRFDVANREMQKL